MLMYLVYFAKLNIYVIVMLALIFFASFFTHRQPSMGWLRVSLIVHWSGRWLGATWMPFILLNSLRHPKLSDVFTVNSEIHDDLNTTSEFFGHMSYIEAKFICYLIRVAKDSFTWALYIRNQNRNTLKCRRVVINGRWPKKLKIMIKPYRLREV